MKINIRNLSFGVLFLSCFTSYGQDFTSAALVPTTFNEQGDPLINIVDANGARQGEWFYKDHLNQVCLKKSYVDNNVVNSFIQVGSDQSPEWVNFDAFNTVNDHILQAPEHLKQSINNHLIDWEENQVLVYRYNADLTTKFLGSWNAEQMTALRNEIINYFNTTTNELPTNFKIILAL